MAADKLMDDRRPTTDGRVANEANKKDVESSAFIGGDNKQTINPLIINETRVQVLPRLPLSPANGWLAGRPVIHSFMSSFLLAIHSSLVSSGDKYLPRHQRWTDPHPQSAQRPSNPKSVEQ